VWRPVIAWADKFKFESVEGRGARSFVLTLLRRRESLPRSIAVRSDRWKNA